MTWSLGIEEQFYLLVAIILPLLARFERVNWIVPACLSLMITSIALRILNNFSFPQYSNYYALQFRADSLAAGVVISWYYHFRHEKFKSWVTKHATVLFFLSIIFLLPSFIFPYADPRVLAVSFTSVWFGYNGIVALLLFLPGIKPFWRLLFNKNKLMLAIAWIGFYSYAIYLFHVFVGSAVVSNFERYVWANAPVYLPFLIFISSNILFAFMISRLIEQPVLMWRDRVFPPKEKSCWRCQVHKVPPQFSIKSSKTA